MPDLKRRLPGRGLWITATREALRTAVARKVFARGFKRDVRVGADFMEMTERLIEAAALDALAIAHKSGNVAIGFAKADAAHHPWHGRRGLARGGGRTGRGQEAPGQPARPIWSGHRQNPCHRVL